MSVPTADQVAIALVTACAALGVGKELALEIAAGARNPRVAGDYTISRARAYAVAALVDGLGTHGATAARLCGVSRASQQSYLFTITGKYLPKWWDDEIHCAVKRAVILAAIEPTPSFSVANLADHPIEDWPSLDEIARIKRPLGRNVTAEIMGDPPPDRPRF